MSVGRRTRGNARQCGEILFEDIIRKVPSISMGQNISFDGVVFVFAPWAGNMLLTVVVPVPVPV